jgi:hypothetical protein
MAACIKIYTQEGEPRYFTESTWPLIASAGTYCFIEVRRCRLYSGPNPLLLTDGKYVANSYIRGGGYCGRGSRARTGFLVHAIEDLEKVVRRLSLKHGYSLKFAEGLMQQVRNYENATR